MEIDWYGHSCFRIKEQGVTIVTDPYDKSLGYNMPRVKADIVTVSHQSPSHNGVATVRGEPKVLAKPGEYEVRGVFVTGIQTWRRSVPDSKDENVVFVFEFNELTLCHLGDLSQVLIQAQVEALPDIDILLVPVGGSGALDADKAAEVISLLEPRLVIPMHYRTEMPATAAFDPLNRFLKAMGVTEQAPQPDLRITHGDLPTETQVIILDCKQSA